MVHFQQLSNVARGQRQVMHQLDTLNNFLRENLGERSYSAGTNKKTGMAYLEPVGASLILTLAIGSLGIFLFKGFNRQN